MAISTRRWSRIRFWQPDSLRFRDERTGDAGFRRLLTEVTQMLVYEALAGAETIPTPITTPVGPADGVTLAAPPLFAPVLRAGLGMFEPALRLAPRRGSDSSASRATRRRPFRTSTWCRYPTT